MAFIYPNKNMNVKENIRKDENRYNDIQGYLKGKCQPKERWYEKQMGTGGQLLSAAIMALAFWAMILLFAR